MDLIPATGLGPFDSLSEMDEDCSQNQGHFASLSEKEEEYIQRQLQQIVEAVDAVYKISHCVVDFVSPADTVICPCGHQCVNHGNVQGITSCPLCLSPVTAFIRAENFC
eukprot:scaffold810_cov117-Cylindrotheca_fusiformis.AAC.3